MRYVSIPVCLLLALIAGCGKSNSEYVGRWQGVEVPAEQFEVRQNGDGFIVQGKDMPVWGYDRGSYKSPGAVDPKGLTFHSNNGINQYTYVKADDTLLGIGPCCMSRTFKRAK